MGDPEAFEPAIRSVLVTGGSGFLGRAILRELRKPAAVGFTPPDEIRVFDIGRLEDPDATDVISILGDIRSYDDILEACRGIDVVIHCASLVDFGHASPGVLEEINRGGTETVIRACREAGVRGLVHTSTMDVVYGGEPIANGDETLPFPPEGADEYARSKAQGEAAAISANDAPRTSRRGETDPRLRTCVIRPCGMYGEADPYHVSNVLRTLQAGKLAARLGNGKAIFQHVYVGNVAHAHVLAMGRLLERDSPVAGATYIITDFPAVNFFDFMEPIASRLGYAMPPRTRRVPYPLAYALGAASEFLARICRPLFHWQPTLTRSSVRIVCQDMWFNGDKAARDLGYKPIYSEAESLDRTVRYFRTHGPLPAPTMR